MHQTGSVSTLLPEEEEGFPPAQQQAHPTETHLNQWEAVIV